MNKQQIFETAIKGIIAQGGPSVDQGGNCVYRAVNGSKCAIGHLITDEHYNINLEGRSITSSYVLEAVKASGIVISNDDDMKFITNLQACHDWAFNDSADTDPNFDPETNESAFFLPTFTDKARKLAKTFKLDASFLA